MAKIFMDIGMLITELSFRTSRSSGAGGQHVNKVDTRVELLFEVNASEALSAEEKEIVNQQLGSRISKSGILIMRCQKTRSQLKNKEIVTERFVDLITKALQPKKKRKPGKPPKSSVEKRLNLKRMKSEKKARRQPPSQENG